MKYFILTVFIVIFSGCSTKLPVMNKYTIQSKSITKIDKPKYKNKILKIAYTRNIKDKISYKMKYSYSLIEQGEYRNSQWANDIEQLLQAVFVDTFEKSKIFATVLPYTSLLKEDYRLESYIYDFSHHIRGSRSYAAMSIQFNLIDTGSNKLIKSRRFSYQEPTKTTNARGYANATNKIIAKLCRDFLRWI